MPSSGPLWAITCLFNPAGFRSRVESFRTFRENLGLPLLAVELAWDEPFSLREGDADILVQLRGGAKLWQKERLLNVAIKNLPSACTKVVWLDADLLFRELNWTEMVQERLEEVPMVQAFAMVRYLNPDGSTDRTRPSVGSILAGSKPDAGWLESSMDRSEGSPSPGHAWAARREFLEEVEFYDGCVIGGGDTATLCAFTGEFESLMRMHEMGPSQADRYLKWGRPLEGIVDIGCIPGVIDHLWHGSMEDRNGRERHSGISSRGFNPYSDLEIGANGAWHWKSDNTDLQSYLQNYFKRRNEDSALVISATE